MAWWLPQTSNQLLEILWPEPSKNWTRHGYQGSQIVGDYIYIVGGEVAIGSVPYSSNVPSPKYTWFPMNMSVSLPLDKSWNTGNDVQYSLTIKPLSPTINMAELMYDQASDCLYSFGGEKSNLDPMPIDLSIWKFQLNGGGGGTWTQNASALQAPFASNPGLTRPAGGAFAQTNDTAFYLGGYMTRRTSPLVTDGNAVIPLPGLITYNFANGTFANSTIGLDNVSPGGNFDYGGMQYVDTFGPNGLIVIWGGDTSNSTMYNSGTEKRPMNTVTLLDPVSLDWYTQSIPGIVPSMRSRFCAIDVADPRPLATEAKNSTGTGTHEIYMYAGWNGLLGAGNDEYDEVWVFSLPGMTWQRVDASQNMARIGHTCHLVGNRQMISIGGVDASQTDPWGSIDVFQNGIGVFDLTESKWTSGYNASAAPYQRPKILQDWYDKNGAYPASWSSPLLQNLIVPGSAPAGSSNSPASGSSTLSATAHSPSTSHIVIIVACTVAVLLAALIPFCLLFWYIRRKYRREDSAYLSEMNAEDIFRHEMYAGEKSRVGSAYGNRYGGRSYGGSRAHSRGDYGRSRSHISTRTGRFFAELDASGRKSAARSRVGDGEKTPRVLCREIQSPMSDKGFQSPSSEKSMGFGISPLSPY